MRATKVGWAKAAADDTVADGVKKHINDISKVGLGDRKL